MKKFLNHLMEHVGLKIWYLAAVHASSIPRGVRSKTSWVTNKMIQENDGKERYTRVENTW